MPQAQHQDDFDMSAYDIDALSPGAKLLRGQYTIERYLSSGGFGITYLARDSLDRQVVIKECYPEALCVRDNQTVRSRASGSTGEFESLVKMFVREARSIAKLDHPNIVGVHQVFEDNETAYMALDLIEGQDLLCVMQDDPQSLTPARVGALLRTLLEAIQTVHDQDMLHRDISPDNILVDGWGNPVLIDFGAAREHASKKSRAVSALLVVKDGYSPQEFYISGGLQGACSDLYSLAATFVHVITGTAPPNSQNRLAALASDRPDPYKPLLGRVDGYAPAFLSAIDMAMRVFPDDRIQSAQDWLAMIASDEAPVAVTAPPKTADDIEKVIAALVTQEEQEPVIAAVPQPKSAPQPAPVEKKITYLIDDDEPIAQSQPAPVKPANEVVKRFWQNHDLATHQARQQFMRRKRARRLSWLFCLMVLGLAAHIFTNPSDNLVSRTLPGTQVWIDAVVAWSHQIATSVLTLLSAT